MQYSVALLTLPHSCSKLLTIFYVAVRILIGYLLHGTARWFGLSVVEHTSCTNTFVDLMPAIPVIIALPDFRRGLIDMSGW